MPTNRFKTVMNTQILSKQNKNIMHKIYAHKSFTFLSIALLLSITYWGLIASDRYVSETHVIMVNTQMSPSSSSNGLLGGANSNGGSAEFIASQMWLKDYLLSVDMMEALDAKLNLRAHYSDWHHDPLSRMWLCCNYNKLEKFHDYYRSRVSAELDNNSGALVIKVQAYDPKMAHAIASMLIEKGEEYMNSTAQRMLEEQMVFLKKQVEIIKEEDIKTHSMLTNFQNKKGLISPITTAASIDSVVNSLDAQRVSIEASRNAMLAYLMPNNPSILALDQQLEALKKQIKSERSRLTSTDNSKLNDTSDQSIRLQIDVNLMDATYAAALSSLETGRVMAALMMRKMFVLQAPTVPQYSVEPRRMYNITVFIFAMLILAGIAQLLIAIIRDHKD